MNFQADNENWLLQNHVSSLLQSKRSPRTPGKFFLADPQKPLSSVKRFRLKDELPQKVFEAFSNDSLSTRSGTRRGLTSLRDRKSKSRENNSTILKTQTYLDNLTPCSQFRTFERMASDTERIKTESSLVRPQTSHSNLTLNLQHPKLHHIQKLSIVSPGRTNFTPIARKKSKPLESARDISINFTPQTATHLLQSRAKKLILAKKVTQAFESTVEHNPELQSSFHQQESERKHSEADEVHSNQNSLEATQESLQQMISMIKVAIDHRSSKLVIEVQLDSIIEISQRLKNIELRITALKTYGKIMFIQNEISKAVYIYKILKKFCDQESLFEVKLKVYKFLASCFQRAKNHKMAIFYNVKMLQTAWMCNLTQFELLAYDNIGMQYYYESEIDKATYYHEKMMAGNIEQKTSQLRQLGVKKLYDKTMENAQEIKKFHTPNKMQNLHDHEIPLSEDDFDLPLPRTQQRYNQEKPVLSKQTIQATIRIQQEINRKKSLEKTKGSSTSRITSMRSINNLKSRADLSSLNDTQESDLRLRRKNKDLFGGTLNPSILLSHLSPNRTLYNFQLKDSKVQEDFFLDRRIETDDNSSTLDVKTQEIVRKKLEKLKKNAESFLKRVIEMQMVQKKLKQQKLAAKLPEKLKLQRSLNPKKFMERVRGVEL